MGEVGRSAVYAWGSASFGRLGTGMASGTARRPRRVVGGAHERGDNRHAMTR